jgi:hypothetical protein
MIWRYFTGESLWLWDNCVLAANYLVKGLEDLDKPIRSI